MDKKTHTTIKLSTDEIAGILLARMRDYHDIDCDAKGELEELSSDGATVVFVSSEST